MSFVTATFFLLLLAGRASAQSFVYPYDGLQETYDETFTQGACLGVFVGANTNFICSCAGSEGWYSFVSCVPASSDDVTTYCTAQGISPGNCLTSNCPGGVCPPLEMNGNVVPSTTCSDSTTLGWKIGAGCGCYTATSGRYTACFGASEVCISEKLNLGGAGTGATSYLCGAYVTASSSSLTTTVTAEATSSPSPSASPVVESTTTTTSEIPSTTTSEAAASTTTTEASSTLVSSSAASETSSSATSASSPGASPSVAFPYPYHFTGSSTFDETFSAGSCPGVFVGANTQFICQCATTESTSLFVSCAPADSTAVSAFCNGGSSTDQCYTKLCPSGTCDPLELSGFVITPSTCTGGQTLGYMFPGNCGCFHESTKFTSCESDTTSVCITESIQGAVGNGGSTSRCAPQCETAGYAPDASGTCVPASSSSASVASATSGSASGAVVTSSSSPSSASPVVAPTSATSSGSVASPAPSSDAAPSININALSVTVDASASSASPSPTSSSSSSCPLYSFVFSPKCCPNTYIRQLSTLSKRHLKLPAAHRHAKRNADADAANAVTLANNYGDDCSPQNVFMETDCPKGDLRKAQKLDDRRLLRHYKNSGGGNVLVDCGSKGLYLF